MNKRKLGNSNLEVSALGLRCMDEAKRLLRETKKSVVEIALDVGYANPSHFA